MNFFQAIANAGKVKGARPVSGLQRFNINTIAADVAGGMVTNMQLHNGELRPDFDNDPNALFLTSYGGHTWLEHRLNPTLPADRFPTTEGDHHYRIEISEYPWNIQRPLGVEIWFSKSYFVLPTVTQWTQGALVIFQAKDSSDSTNPETSSPVLSLEIAYPGQLAHGSDPLRQTPLGGEPIFVGLGKDTRWTPIGAPRLAPGMRLDYVTHIVAQADGTGLWENWLNGVKYVFPGYTSGGVERPAGDNQITAMGTYEGLGTRFPNIKSGLYHLGYKHEGAAEIAAGHTQMRLLTTNWNMMVRTSDHWDYMNNNGYAAVDTSNYNI
jgi:hypothetical protein